MTINSMSQSFMFNSISNRPRCNSYKPKSISRQCCCHSFGYAQQNIHKLNNILDEKVRESVKTNKQLEEYRTTSSEFYSEFDPIMSDLKDAAAKLKSTSMESTLNPMSYASNNGNVVTAVTGSLNNGKAIDIDVSQIATAKGNVFSEISATDKGDFVGESSVILEVDGKKTTINFDISAAQSNEDALNEIVNKINKEQTGVEAKVEIKDGKAQLSFLSEKTGKQSEFTAEITGALKTELGQATVTAGQDAKYSVDGKEFTSEINEITLADGKITATLTGSGKANISNKNIDTSEALASLKDFAGKYNDAVDFLNENKGISSEISNLAYSFGLTRFMSNTLSDVGISTDGKGRLTVNDDAFTSAMKKDPSKVQDIIGKHNGLAGTAYKKATSAIINSSSLIPMPDNYNKFYSSTIGMMMDCYG